GEFEVLEAREIGRGHLRLRLRHRAGGSVLAAIHFGGWTGEPPSGRLRLAYQLDLDDWGGRRGVQLLVRHLEPAPMVCFAAFRATHHRRSARNSIPSASGSPTSGNGWIRSGVSLTSTRRSNVSRK